MKTPKIQLKNVKYFEGHDTMQGMNADVWIDGVKCMHVYDSAHGGGYEYRNETYKNPKAEQIKSLIKNFEDYIKTLPARTYVMGGTTSTFPVDMDGFICDLAEQMEMEKQMKRKILVGIPNSTQYSYYNFKMPLAKVPQGQLQASILRIKSNLEKGEVILNTNLTALGITI